jgi:hypothetical protein
MIALLVNGVVEVAVGDFTMNLQRTKAVGFTVPVSESVYATLMTSNVVKFMFFVFCLLSHLFLITYTETRTYYFLFQNYNLSISCTLHGNSLP